MVASLRTGHAARRAPVAALLTVAALAAGGCGNASPSANLFVIPKNPSQPHIPLSSQELMHQLEQPTSHGPGGYEMLAGSQRLSLRGIQYTTQGRDALEAWLNSPSTNKASYRQAGQNLAVAFPSDKAKIEDKLK